VSLVLIAPTPVAARFMRFVLWLSYRFPCLFGEKFVALDRCTSSVLGIRYAMISDCVSLGSTRTGTEAPGWKPGSATIASTWRCVTA
jgi:hypothetical protein